MSLQTLANLAEVFGAVLVVGGFLFAALEIAHYRQDRRDRSALELARSFGTPEFAQALRVILSLPAGADADGMRRAGAETENAAMLVSLTLESVGIMVHRRTIELELVWELMGGVLLSAWERLEGWTRFQRAEQGREKFNEWIEWLVGQLRANFEDRGLAPAHVRYAGWTPHTRTWGRRAGVGTAAAPGAGTAAGRAGEAGSKTVTGRGWERESGRESGTDADDGPRTRDG